MDFGDEVFFLCDELLAVNSDEAAHLDTAHGILVTFEQLVVSESLELFGGCHGCRHSLVAGFAAGDMEHQAE